MTLDHLKEAREHLQTAMMRFNVCYDATALPMAMALLALLDDAIERREEARKAEDPRYFGEVPL